MGKINVNYLKPGMVLNRDLRHSNGRFLLAKGVTLDTTHLHILKTWGVDAVDVEGASEDFQPITEDRIDPSVLQTAEKKIQKRFVHSNLNHPFLRELFRICTLRRARQMVQQKSTEGSIISDIPKATPFSKSKFIPTPSNGKINPYTLVHDNISLPTHTDIFMEISKVLNNPRSSAVHIADVISKDPSLSAKLLKIVNSAFYGFPSKIDTIPRAVTIVGSRQLSALVVGASVIKLFQDIPHELIDMKSFWEHSITCGISARMIASYKNISDTERLFVAGLLHDIGRVILYQYLPHRGREILIKAKQTDCLLSSVELDTLGFDHTQIGGILLKKWNLPLTLENAVQYHHNPPKSQYVLEASIVYLSDILANALGIGTSGESFVHSIIPEVWEELGLSKEIFTTIVQLVDRQVAEIFHTFFDER